MAGLWKAHAPLDMGSVGAVNKQIIRVADAILPDDVPAFHQITDVSAAQFLTLATSSSLANERVFVPGAGLTATDGGAGGAYTLNVVAANATITVNADSIQVGILPNKFIVQGTTDATLSAAQFLGALATGIVKNTTTTGVLSIAVGGAGGDYEFPLTFSQGVTRAVNTVTGDYITGIALGGSGNRTIWTGGTGTGEGIIIRTTSHATRGKFTIGTMTYDEATFRLGIGQSSPAKSLDIAGDMRIGNGPGLGYDIGRDAGDGMLYFIGTQSGFAGFVFSGTTGGQRMFIADGGVVQINNLGGATSTLVKTDTVGQLSRATAGMDYQAIITLTAGAGLTGGGTTAANRTFDVVANADATIVVNADDIKAGVMQTANYAAGSVTFPKIEALTSSHLLGRGSASSGNPESIIIGTGLAMTGTTLSATATSGAPTDAQYLTLATHASLSAERVLNMTTGFTVSDGGANGNYTVTNDVFTGQSGSPTWQGSSNSNNLTIRANTSSTGTLTLTADRVLLSVAGTTVSADTDVIYFRIQPAATTYTAAAQPAYVLSCFVDSFVVATSSGTVITNLVGLYTRAPTISGGGTATNIYSLWSDALSRFDGNGTYVFELPGVTLGAPTAATHYISVNVIGVGQRWIPLVDNSP